MVKGKFNWFFELDKFGIRMDAEDEVSRRIAFSNVIFISLPIVYLLFILIDFKSFFRPISLLQFDQFIVPIVILICILCLWLNKLKFTTISRILFIVQWPFLLHIIPIKLLQTPPDYYIAFPFGIVFHSILIQLMFSHRKEAGFFWTFLVFNFITMLLAGDILAYFVSAESSPNEIINDRYYLLDGILYWLLFNLVMFYILLVIEEYIKKVNNSKGLIESQKEKLNKLNIGLEKMVSERTLKLEEQNTKLKGYAFYNAHLLRAPFCRVQGLIQLINMTGNHLDENDEIMVRLADSLDELDTVIKKIQVIVDHEV